MLFVVWGVFVVCVALLESVSLLRAAAFEALVMFEEFGLFAKSVPFDAFVLFAKSVPFDAFVLFAKSVSCGTFVLFEESVSCGTFVLFEALVPFVKLYCLLFAGGIYPSVPLSDRVVLG